MKKLVYQAVFEPTDDGYSVYFPDLPGCVSFGESLEDAQNQAAEALGLHLYGMEQDGETIPPSSKTLSVDPATAQGYLVCPVTVFPDLVRNELDSRRVKTNVTIPAWVKTVAQERNLNCSKLLELAILDAAGIRPIDPSRL
ncbi:type II toxin-antitoxin system HicB family antitoxin [Anaerotruncus rubiinfantis]|uniref:type II toxin-antitoxin system HicB family antitoxin n=1 Tax=Anaerotruncus rubiinfantis TaxID=1720200 RepID=UPI0011C7C25C|nr:type II toxin-antitoxin system HicB family antitoxin [Anaerotruncus rubiinfantis]